jgi:hypothetical protein
MDVPGTFDHAIRYTVPHYQRSTFDRTVAGLPTDFLSDPVTGEVFGSKADCKARLQGFALSQGLAVVVGSLRKIVEVEVLDGLAECADALLGRNGAKDRRGMEREREWDGVDEAGGAETRRVSLD